MYICPKVSVIFFVLMVSNFTVAHRTAQILGWLFVSHAHTLHLYIYILRKLNQHRRGLMLCTCSDNCTQRYCAHNKTLIFDTPHI